MYSGDSLRHIKCPVGGIGTGNVLIGGRGEIHELEIFGQADVDELRPYMTFFSLWIKKGDDKPQVKILERELFNDFPNGFGVPRTQLGGIGRFHEVEFNASYPFINLNFLDEMIPLEIELEVYNPFIPLSVEDSSLPIGVFNWNFSNNTLDTIIFSVCFSMGNPFNPANRGRQRTHGGTENILIKNNDFTGINMRYHPGDKTEKMGDLTMYTSEKQPEIQTGWFKGNWWDNAHIFWRDFSEDGHLKQVTEKTFNKGGISDVSSLLVSDTLFPGDEKQVPFYISWYIPYRRTEPSMSLGNPDARSVLVKNHYADGYQNSINVASRFMEQQDELYMKTYHYQQLLTNSSYPPEVIDAVMSNTAILKTNLLSRGPEGNVHAFEGLGNNFGCCPGNCTHVWNYAQTLAFLFPSLERNMRETAFIHDTHENGYQNFRTVFPPGDYYFKNVAADGQMGNIIRVYREWKLHGDNDWLKTLWPGVKAALEFAWGGSKDRAEEYPWTEKYKDIPWDPYKEGVLRGDQHNTYDINFFGPNMMTGSLYLGALKAASEMAVVLDDKTKAGEYLSLYRNGQREYNEMLWNGEYYEQFIEVIEGLEIPVHLQSPPDKEGKVWPKYQYGQGCLSDQLLGQFLSHVAGLGYILDEGRVDSALYSIFKYNFVNNFRDFHHVQRIYALNGEAGLITCSWPKGNRPLLPFVYADETWTGIEYQVAATLIYSGFIEEGIELVEAVRNRYRGYNRNPYAEIESGFYYARALASWAVMLALSGFEYDGVNHSMAFQPRIHQRNFNTFWSCGGAWGNFELNDEKAVLSVEYGKLSLNKFSVFTIFKNPEITSVTLNGTQITYDKDISGMEHDKEGFKNRITVYFTNKNTITAGNKLSIHF